MSNLKAKLCVHVKMEDCPWLSSLVKVPCSIKSLVNDYIYSIDLLINLEILDIVRGGKVEQFSHFPEQTNQQCTCKTDWLHKL